MHSSKSSSHCLPTTFTISFQNYRSIYVKILYCATLTGAKKLIIGYQTVSVQIKQDRVRVQFLMCNMQLGFSWMRKQGNHLDRL